MPLYETERWPIIKARHFKKIEGMREVRLIVIHTMEAPEGPQTAENVARWFSTTPTVASAHVCVDEDSVVQCVWDRDVAYAAPGANHDGIQVELAGYARQTRAQWADKYSIRLLMMAADVVAQYCLKFSIPPLHLFDHNLRDGQRGIVGHDQVTRVYGRSTHTDPGPQFPWTFFEEAVILFYDARRRE